DGPLPRRETGEGPLEVHTLVEVCRLGRLVGHLGYVLRGNLSGRCPATFAEEEVDEDAPGVRFGVVETDPVPVAVQPDEGGLDEVLRPLPVTAQPVCGPAQRLSTRREELDELLVAFLAAHRTSSLDSRGTIRPLS